MFFSCFKGRQRYSIDNCITFYQIDCIIIPFCHPYVFNINHSFQLISVFRFFHIRIIYFRKFIISCRCNFQGIQTHCIGIFFIFVSKRIDPKDSCKGTIICQEHCVVLDCTADVRDIYPFTPELFRLVVNVCIHFDICEIICLIPY